MTSPLYLDDKALAVRFAVAVQTIWHWSRIGHFPAPVKLSAGVTRWRLSDVEAFEKRMAENPALKPHRGRPRKKAVAAATA